MQIDDSSNPSPPSSDQMLLARFRTGDEDAALQLYFRYANRLLRLTSKETAGDLGSRFDPEDIVQSVFRTFFRRAATGQYEAPEGDELWKLLLVMALNKLRTRSSYHRARKRDVRKTQSIEANDSRLDPASQEEAKNVLRLSIEEIIEQQPESHRDIIRLRIEGHNVQEIADNLRKSKRTVERVLQSFRNELMNSTLLNCPDSDSADSTEGSR
jgi:RNA polymerase sigma-70 factor (ECF subfamily)